MADAPPRLSRRRFVRATAGAATLGAAVEPAAAQRSHTVEMTGDLTFEPATVTVTAGDRVVWENVSGFGHTATAYGDAIPADADYFASGGFGSESAARDGYPEGDVAAGESYGHAFEVPGTYDYFCVPHESAGMTGTVEVEPGGGGPTPGAGRPVLPKSPLTGAVLTGVLLVAAAVTWFKVFVEGGE